MAEVTLAIDPTARYLDRVDRRDHVGGDRLAAAFFAPAGVAVIGASPRRGSIGGELFRNIIAGDFAGAAYPGQSRRDAGLGRARVLVDRRRPDAGRPGGDRACRPSGCSTRPRRALSIGVRALCVISAGFAETGAAGAERQDRLLALVRSHGGRLIGPNCLGIAASGPRLNATFGPPVIPAGNIGFSSQSGALGLAFLQEATARGLGLSAFVSIGNKADVSSNDLLEYFGGRRRRPS